MGKGHDAAKVATDVAKPKKGLGGKLLDNFKKNHKENHDQFSSVFSGLVNGGAQADAANMPRGGGAQITDLSDGGGYQAPPMVNLLEMLNQAIQPTVQSPSALYGGFRGSQPLTEEERARLQQTGII